jgi:hypothetical protein
MQDRGESGRTKRPVSIVPGIALRPCDHERERASSVERSAPAVFQADWAIMPHEGNAKRTDADEIDDKYDGECQKNQTHVRVHHLLHCQLIGKL